MGVWGIGFTDDEYDYCELGDLYSKAGTEERSTFSKIYAMLRLRELSSLTPPASSKSKLLLLYGCMGGERVGCVCGCVCVWMGVCVCV